jgi:hypothetical protein
MHNPEIRHTIVFWVAVLVVNVFVIAFINGSLFDHKTPHLVPRSTILL